MHIVKSKKLIWKGYILCNSNLMIFWKRNSGVLSCVTLSSPVLFSVNSSCLGLLQLNSTQLPPLNSGRPPGSTWVCPLHAVAWNLPLGSKLRESQGHLISFSQRSLVLVGLCPPSFPLSFYIFCPFFGSFRWEGKSSRCHSILARSGNVAFPLVLMGFQSREEIMHVLISPY